MSFAEVLHELPALTVAEPQMLIRRALELDEPGLPAEDVALVEERLAEHYRNLGSAVPPDEMKNGSRFRF